jgi:RNA polymerase sigma-70 factor (ECF subfamily)
MDIGCASDRVSDFTLIEQAKSDDMSAYDEIVTRYRTRAVRIAQSFLHDRELAEDIAQEAFVRAFLSIRKLRNPEAFTTYLTRTIIRLAIDHSRKFFSTEIMMELDPPAESPKIPFEESMYIHGILEQLSWKLQTVIVLRDIEGMDYLTIAEILKIPVGTVRSRLSAARAAFKALYIGGMAEEEEGV